MSADGHGPGDPEVRLREAIKQLTIARRALPYDDLVHPALDESEVLLRGAADRLEEQADAEEARANVREAIEAAAGGDGA